MNATAKRLGMTRTNFVNTNGLPDPGQVTTARDLAKISRAVITEYPQYASY
jgi:D-alanyl-D-alanine carboxypeptidase